MRRLWWYLVIAPVTTVGLVAASSLLRSPAWAPVLETPHSETVEVPQAESLDEWYAIRDRLQEELANQPPVLISSRTGTATAPTELLQTLQAVEIRIQVEETAKELWEQALAAGSEAAQLGVGDDAPKEDLKHAYELWKEAIDTLQEIPEDSLLADEAAAKIAEYEPNYGVAAYRYDTARSGFLVPIAEQTGMGDRVRITVCSLERECRRLRGNEPPASPASLIKVPVAMALMEKLATENIDPETKIVVSRGNWTEDAAKIWVGSEYTLRKIMYDMIALSGNIATNELIDYVGRDAINQMLRDRGYTVTTVNTKLVGLRTYPVNAGVGPNVINSDELTDMMVSIYNNEHPGDELILDALVNQYDWDLGYSATKLPAVWIGEKTGQNSKVLGTTTAVSINGKRYVITVTIDYTANEPAVRSVVRGIVEHLMEHDGFGPDA